MVEIIKDWSTLKKLIFLKASGAAVDVWRTVSGSIVSFVTERVKPLRSVIVDLEPVQSGSGDPSPDNIRPISGWTGANIFLEHTYDAQATPVKTVSWQTEAGTVYGGSVDVVSGKLTIDRGYFTDNGTSNWIRNPDSSFYLQTTIQTPDQLIVDRCACNYAPYAASFNGMSVFLRSNKLISLARDWGNIYPDADSLKAAFALTPFQMVYPITPQTYQLTPQQIQTLLGDNTVWSDAGDVTVTYSE